MKILIILGMAAGLAGCAALVPAAIGGAAGYAVSQHNAPPADYVPPRPKR